MKIIHCADLHLDSPMTTYLPEEKIEERKSELLGTFFRMVDYARQHQIEAILIAGDLFDGKVVSATVQNAVQQIVRDNEDILFFYLRGNHDEGNLQIEDWGLDNLKLFHQQWRRYVIHSGGKRIAITGMELNQNNSTEMSQSLVLNQEDFNIVMLHGQINEYEVKDKAEVIALDSLRNKGIDYLALGHVHSYREGKLDARGIHCYPGCLEGRGFDECGQHGFVVLDIDVPKRKWSREFVPFSSRCYYSVEIEVSGCDNTIEILNRVKQTLLQRGYGKENLLQVCLTGEMDVAGEKNPAYMENWLKNDYYYIQLKDKTINKIDYESYGKDASLKGEFVRCVREEVELTEEEKACIIRMGLQALAGEEISL